MVRLLRDIKDDEPIGFFGGIKGRAYLFYRSDLSRRLAYLRATSAIALKRDIDQSGVNVLFSIPASEEQNEILDEALRLGYLKPLWGSFYRKG